MKELFLITAFFINSGSVTFSQNFRVSLLTGPSFGWLSSSDNQIKADGAKLGYKVHVNAEYLFKSRYVLHAGIGLTLGQGGALIYEKGGNLWPEPELSNAIYDSLPNGVRLGYSINYLDFPFGFKLRTNEFGKFKFFVNAPEFSLGIRTKGKGSIDGKDIPTSEDEDIHRHIVFINISYGIGIGSEYKISDDISLIGGLRFFQSISDVTDDSGRFFDRAKENSKGLLSSMDVRLGVLF